MFQSFVNWPQLYWYLQFLRKLCCTPEIRNQISRFRDPLFLEWRQVLAINTQLIFNLQIYFALELYQVNLKRQNQFKFHDRLRIPLSSCKTPPIEDIYKVVSDKRRLVMTMMSLCWQSMDRWTPVAWCWKLSATRLLLVYRYMSLLGR